MSRNQQLSAKEEEIMACFWQNGPLFVREVIAMLPDPKPHFNTISTFVRGLEAKGWLTHEQIGNSYRYSAAVDISDYRRNSISKLVGRLFSNDYMNCVSALVSDEKISVDELRELIDRVEAQRKNSSSQSEKS